MGTLMIILCVVPTIVTPITISPNGNSPEIKMIGGMMVDVQKGFMPMVSEQETTTKSNYDKSRTLRPNATKLSINERYRRLIPYMTFYYANDLRPTTEPYSTKNVEVEKAEIVEAMTIQEKQREQKRIIYSAPHNIPRYQGNRLTQFNIASANPTKVFYKDGVPVAYQNSKFTPNYNAFLTDNRFLSQHENERFVQKQIVKSPSAPFTPSTRRPYLNLYSNENSGNVQYYVSNGDQAPKYKLVPYEQTPPVKVSHFEPVYESKNPIPVPVIIPKEQVYIKPRPVRPQYIYDDYKTQQLVPRKQAAVVLENYYEKRRPVVSVQSQPVVESGFKPIISSSITTEAPTYTTLASSPLPPHSEDQRPVQYGERVPLAPTVNDFRPNYFQYFVEQPPYQPEPQPYIPPKTANLADLLTSLQLNKSIPRPITRENVGSSIRTLLQVLNTLKVMSQQNDVKGPVLSTPKPFVVQEEIEEVTAKSVEVTPVPIDDAELHEEPYLAPVNNPSQHLDDDYTSDGGSSQQFPQPVHSDEEGGTPGHPGVDYPVLTVIPPTRFDCKTQRYKGFFADPETRCQVWHYCDLNGGQASFLCPNGTIFSQAALTCDWWFNVKCASTTQLYVLNESLYKYILPHSPKFPEDYSGPLVDKYLTLKFKEMEEQFKKNKNKQSASEKMDTDENEESSEDSNDKESDSTSNRSENIDRSEVSSISEASVMIESPGTSGNVERLHD